MGNNYFWRLMMLSVSTWVSPLCTADYFVFVFCGRAGVRSHLCIHVYVDMTFCKTKRPTRPRNVPFSAGFKLMAGQYLFREHGCWQPLHVQRVRGWKWLALRGLDNLCPPISRFRPCNCHWPMGSRLKLDPGLQLLTSPFERILFWFLMLL